MVFLTSQLRPQQLNTLQNLLMKHISDPTLAEFAQNDDFAVTSTERGLQRWEQAHLVAALDVLNAYQSNRLARASCRLAGYFPGKQRHFTNDPRTRAIEYLKRWLRTRAGDQFVREEEIRGVCGFCRDVLNHPELFPARNPQSFLRTMAEVYEHLQWQLREVLEHDRSCADLTQRLISLSKNFISDVLSYLLLAPTDLCQTDALPSLEVVALWKSLPDEGHPLPRRAEPALQSLMRDTWGSQCGSLVAAILSAPCCVSLFKGLGADNEPVQPEPAEPRLAEVRRQFSSGELRHSGLAGAFRLSAQSGTRQLYVDTAEQALGLAYLIGEVLVLFQRVAHGLGDYGMIRVAPWLHPFLEAVAEKAVRTKSQLERLNEAVEGVYVLARARGVRVERPAPSSRMSARAHAAIERAVTGRDSHMQALLQVVDELKGRSSPDRLPGVMEGIGDACASLQAALASSEFRAHVGDSFPELPALGPSGPVAEPRAGGVAMLEDDDRGALQPSEQLGDARIDAVKLPVDNIVGSVDAGKLRRAAASEAQSPAVAQVTADPEEVVRSQRRKELWALVQCMVPARCGTSLQRKDSRALTISSGHFHIFERGSSTRVKTNVDIGSGIEACKLMPSDPKVLEVIVQRLPKNAQQDSGVMEYKQYTFKFANVQLAAAFKRELTGGR